MVDYHYIKRGNKLYGPYYYRSYRVGKKVKKEYLGKNYPKKICAKKTIKSLLFSFVLLILIASVLYFISYFASITSKATAEPGSTTLENNESSQALAENLTREIIDSISSLNPQVNLSELANMTLNETATEENESNVSEINTTYPLVEQPRVNLSNATNTTEQPTEINETSYPFTQDENITNETGQPTEVKAAVLSETLVQHKAVLGQPVKWTKKITLDSPSNITVELPKEADNITVKKIENESSESVLMDSVTITGQVTSSINLTGRKKEITYLDLIKYLLKKIRAKITGHAIEETVEVKTETIEPEKIIEIKENVTEVEVEYYTEAPAAIEKIISQGKKEITITGPDTIHYTNVLAYTYLPVEVKNSNSIILYWFNGTEKQKTEFNAYDDNSNGYIDRIEWIVPSLSNETYEATITIINVQSYPTVGGNWTVFFNTTGEADLTITAVSDTPWSNYSDNPNSYDLKLLDVRCGNDYKEYQWQTNSADGRNDSVFISNYSCSETGSETSKVLTPSGHTLQFKFSSDVEYALNQAQIIATIIANQTSNFSHAYSYLFDDSANPDTVSDGTEISETDYAGIGRNNYGSLTIAGSAPSDSHLRINYTTPPNEGIYWINITCVMNTSDASDDIPVIYLWNWTKGGSDKVATVADATTSWANLSVNLTERANITDYLQQINSTQQELEVWCSAYGNNADNLGIDYAYIQIKYNETTPPLITVLSPLNQTYPPGTTQLGFNVTLNKESTGCTYSLDSNSNQSMTSDTNTSWWNATVSVTEGSHYTQFYCNNSVGKTNVSGIKYYFYVEIPDYSISACRNITYAGTYTLQNSITDSNDPDACINITTSNVEIDCIDWSFWIDGIDTSTTAGIKSEGISTARLTNVSIKNCNLTDWGGLSGNAGGTVFTYTQNSSIDNSTAYSGRYGIYFGNSIGNNLTNINSSSNSYGITLVLSSNNTLSNITASSSTYYGIYLSVSSNNTLSNITASGNSQYGVYLSPGSNNILTNITALSNTWHGIYIQSSNYNQIRNSTIKGNKQYGLYLYYSRFNNITGTSIENNSVSGYAGIAIESHASTSTSNSSYNRFWDNIINNTAISGGKNWMTAGRNYTNYFNTTKVAGTNIIGGSWIAGNWWSDYTGTSADGDFLGDTAYVINGSLMNDSLPLTLTDTLYQISACKNITQSGTYTLQNSISDWGAPAGQACFNITVSDVEIDCVGWENWIDGIDTSTTAGIKSEGISTARLTNVSIKNCNLTDWGYAGVYYTYTQNSTITNITASSNSLYGIYLRSSSNNNLSNITSSSNPYFGIYLYSSSNNTIRNANITRNSGQGGLLASGTSLSELRNDIDTSNTVSGKPVQYFDGIIKICPNNQVLNYNSTYSHLSLIGCDNVTVNMSADDIIYFYSTNNSRIENSNSSNSLYGIYLYSSSNNNLSNINASVNSWYGIYLRLSSNNNLSNINASSNSNYGIYLDTSSNYNTLTNITASSNSNYGIYLDTSSNYTTLTNINASGNSIGIYLRLSSNNNLSNINASSNSNYGIYLYSSSNYNTLTNITASNNYLYGIRLYSSSNYNTLTNITASNNSQYGIYLDTSSNYNQIINSIIKDNQAYGLYLYYSSFNNITGSIIENNSVYAGINIRSHVSIATSNSSYNLIWNNIINNTYISGGRNWITDGINYTNYFNTTLTAGTNIAGGAWLGGNYWSDYSGASADGDYIGDTPYVINSTAGPKTASNMTDALPLVLTDSGAAGEAPKIVFMLPTPDDGVRQTRNWIYVNVSVNTTNNNVDTCLLEWNAGGGPANETMNKIGTGINVTCWANKTTVGGTTYTYKVYANDSTNTFGNSSSRSNLENSRPGNVSLIYPAHDSSTTNRTPQLNWSASSDAESDSITYQINITCYPSCSGDNRLPNSSANQNWTTLTSRLLYFWDDLYYYNWTVRAWDGYEFGDWNGTPFTLKLSSLISLSMLNATVNFSNLLIGQTENTTTDNPFPLSIQNDGNSFVSINMSNDTALIWSTQQSPSSYYQYKIDNVTGENISFNWTGSITTWTNVPIANVTPITFFNYTDASDSAEIDILVTVPPAEPPGAKSSRLVFTGWYVRET